MLKRANIKFSKTDKGNIEVVGGYLDFWTRISFNEDCSLKSIEAFEG